MIYVYAITDAGQALPPDVGHEDGPLHAVDGGGVRAVCGRVAARPRPDPDALWRHETVVEAAMGLGGALPVRFGTCCDGDDDVRALLARHGARLSQGLADVRGQVELGLRVLWEEQPPPEPDGAGSARAAATGRDYLLARAAEERAERAWREEAGRRAGQLHSALVGRAAAATHDVLPNPRTLMAAAYLVEPDDVGDFREAVAALGEEHPELVLVPTGPWPPYSFAPPLEEEPARVP